MRLAIVVEKSPDFVNHHSEAEGDILFDMLRLLSFVALLQQCCRLIGAS
jgi:hypothetical protein